MPPGYLAAIEEELKRKPADAFGGPDRAHDSFTSTQKAINYAMTSFFTTGGIRGGKKKMDKFYPRSFNMGLKADVYRALGGFSKMRFGEDIDLSIRIFKGGYSCRLFPEAWVWHKPRITESSASASGCIHPRCSASIAQFTDLPIRIVAIGYVCNNNLYRLFHPEQKPLDRYSVGTGRIHTTHRLRIGIPVRLVETLHTEKGFFLCLREEFL